MSNVTQLADGLSIMHRLAQTPRGKTPIWSEIGSPVIDRDTYAIFPLAVAALAPDDEPDELVLGSKGDLLAVEWELRLACMHYYGGGGVHGEMHLELDRGYGWSLADVGFLVPRANWVLWWEVGVYAVTLVRALDRTRRCETLALHVTPSGWVYDRGLPSRSEAEERRALRLLRKGRAADASWDLP